MLEPSPCNAYSTCLQIYFKHTRIAEIPSLATTNYSLYLWSNQTMISIFRSSGANSWLFSWCDLISMWACFLPPIQGPFWTLPTTFLKTLWEPFTNVFSSLGVHSSLSFSPSLFSISFSLSDEVPSSVNWFNCSRSCWDPSAGSRGVSALQSNILFVVYPSIWS